MNRNLASALSVAAVTMAAAAAVAALVGAGVARADDITVETTPFVSSKSRADVQSELSGRSELPANATGEWVLQNNEQSPYKSSYTPRQARDEYTASRFQVNALTGEDSGSAYLKMTPPGASPTTIMGAPPAQ